MIILLGMSAAAFIVAIFGGPVELVLRLIAAAVFMPIIIWFLTRCLTPLKNRK